MGNEGARQSSRLFRPNSPENAKISVPKRLNIYICSFYYKNVSPGSTAPDERAKSTSSLTHVRSARPTPGGRRAVLFLLSRPQARTASEKSLLSFFPPSFPRKRESRSPRTAQPLEAKTARPCQNQDSRDWRDFQDFDFAHLALFAAAGKSRQSEYGQALFGRKRASGRNPENPIIPQIPILTRRARVSEPHRHAIRSRLAARRQRPRRRVSRDYLAASEHPAVGRH